MSTQNAVAALADANAQHQLLEAQLAAISDELKTAIVGTAHHLSLSQRALGLREQIQELSKVIASLKEQTKTGAERDQENAAAAAAARAALLARVAADKEKTVSLIAEINAASDRLAEALAAAAQYVPPIIEDLAEHGGLRLSGPWPTILPSAWGEGRITSIPWVSVLDGNATLSTRGKHGKHLG